MKGHIAKALICVVSAVCFVAATAASAEYSGSQVFNNEFETSGVDVKIEQLQIQKSIVLPGEKISYVPRVTNLNTDSFVRVRFDIKTDNPSGTVIGPDAFFGVADGWIRKGNYFYNTKLMKTGETKEVLKGIDFSEDCSSGGREIRIEATVDAIQANNFTPNFEKAMPWGDVRIQRKSVTSYMASETTPLKSEKVSSGVSPDFTYAREGVFMCSTEDLFSEFDSFKPGDVCSELLNMKNKSDRDLEIHFRTENKKTNLLDEMRLSISCCGREVYKGTLASEELKSFISIGTIPSEKSGKFEFEISMPESADNSFSELKDNVTWIIAVNETGKDKKHSDVVATGDKLFLPAMALLALTGSLLTLIIAVLADSRKRRNR